MSVELVVRPTAEEAAQEAAERLARAAAAGGAIALAGGSTPRRAYELAAGIQPDWSRASIWFGDERCVPPDDERSNFLLARQALLARVARPPEEVHRIRGELGGEAAAEEYDGELEGVTLDLVLLGIGPDGHTASLFPNSPALEERERRAVAAGAKLEPFVPRVTLTLPALGGAGEILFLITGGEKAEAAHRAFAGRPSPATPASLVRSEKGTTVAILDSRAAVRLGSTPPAP